MVKFKKKTIGVLGILLMLATAPLGVSYSYADSTMENRHFEDEDEKTSYKSLERDQYDAILTEKLVDGELEVKQFVLPENTSKEDLNRILSLDGTSGWSYVNFKPYHSGIVLFDGKVSKDGEKYWKISVQGTMNLSKVEFDLQLKKESKIMEQQHGKSLEGEYDYKVIFSGKMEESDEKNVFAVAIMNSTQNSDLVKNPKISQFGSQTFVSVPLTDCIKNVKNSNFLV